MNGRSRDIAAGGNGRRGFVLIIVMVIVAMVAFAGFAFVNTMSDEYRAVDTNGDQLEAEQTLASAELAVLMALDQRDSEEVVRGPQTAESDVGQDPLFDNPLLFQEQLVLPTREEQTAEDDELAWRFSVVSPNRNDDLAGAERPLRHGLENESARLHLATLMEIDALDPERSRDALLGFPGMTESAADSLLDWLDADSERRQSGAEAQDYLDRPNPVKPRNGLPVGLDEILLVRDVPRLLLFGPDENRNFVLDRGESNPRDALIGGGVQESDETLNGLGWADLLTLDSAERNVDSRGAPRIDLNQPDMNRLRQELAAVFPAEVADFVILYRTHGPAGRVSGVSSNSGGPTSPGTVRSSLSSVADLIGATVSASDGSSSQVVQSPVTADSRELLEALLDRTTTDPNPVIPGRINVNLAARPVLRAVPGLDDENIERIVGRRSMLEGPQSQTVSWLLTEQILTLEQFREALPYITSGGDVYRAQLIAWRPTGGMYRRAEVICDATRPRARRLAYRDLSAFGAAIPVAWLSQLEAVR